MRDILAECDYKNLIDRISYAAKLAFESSKDRFHSRFLITRLDRDTRYPAVEDMTADQIDKMAIQQYADRYWDFYFVYDTHTDAMYKVYDKFLIRNMYETIHCTQIF